MKNAKINVTELERYIEQWKYDSPIKNNPENKDHFPECLIFNKQQVGNIFYDYHHHDTYEILYINKGRVTYGIENIKIKLEEGDLIIISPTLLHKLIEINETPCERTIITFPERYIKLFCTPRTNLLKVFELSCQLKYYKVSINNIWRNKFETLLSIMSDTLFENDFGTDLVFNAAFVQAMIIISRTFFNSKDSYDHYSSYNISIIKATEYIEDNLHNKLHISDIANYANLSTSRLQHIFKEEIGISLIKYINKKRLVKAKELLRNGENAINIYQKCGFQDYTSFFRAFRKEYDMTPKSYQLQYKEFMRKN